MTGFTSGLLQIALVPLDVQNTQGDMGLSMYTAWLVLLITNSTLMIFVIPYLLFYYDSDPEVGIVGHFENRSQE